MDGSGSSAAATDYAARQQQRQQNRQVAYPPSSLFGSLDASVKKTTAYTKKLRPALADASQHAALLAEAEKLNLSKYMEEVCAALAQVRAGTFKATAQPSIPPPQGIRNKKGEVGTAVALAQLLHRRYKEFVETLSEPLAAQLALGLVATDKDDVAAFRQLFRFYSELVLLGILPEEEGKLLCKRLADLMKRDKDSLQQLPLIVSLLRGVVPELTGVLPRRQQSSDAPVVVFPNLQPQMKQLLQNYFDKVCEKLLEAKKTLNKRMQLDEVQMEIKV
jgi:hypothetical protein